MINEDQTFNPYECFICTSSYTAKEGSKPRILQCGHTYCESCLTTLLESRKCPSCVSPILYDTVEDIPVNYVLKNICEDHNKEFDSNDFLPYGGYCSSHRSYMHFKCLDCDIFICGTCSILKHDKCGKIFVKNVIEDLQSKLMNDIELVKLHLQKKQGEYEAKDLPLKKRLESLDEQKLNLEVALMKVNEEINDILDKRTIQSVSL